MIVYGVNGCILAIHFYAEWADDKATAEFIQDKLSNNAHAQSEHGALDATSGLLARADVEEGSSLLSKKIQIIPLRASADVVEVLTIVAMCESGHNPFARNPHSSAKGLLQIIDGTWAAFGCAGNVFDAADNMRCGIRIATESGLHHWDASRSCWYDRVRHLPHMAESLSYITATQLQQE